MNWPDAEKREVFLGPNLIFTLRMLRSSEAPSEGRSQVRCSITKISRVEGDIIQI